MSGGSYDYLYNKIEDAAHQIGRGHKEGETAMLRLAFADHLLLVADAMHAVEWVDSGDYGSGDEDDAIRACLAPGVVLAKATEEAERVYAALGTPLGKAAP